MSIATKTGDTGETSLLGGERISKNDPRLEAYGTIDELNATIGVALAYIEDSEVKETLGQVQHDLFRLGAQIAALTSKELTMEIPKLEAKQVEFIENALNKIEPTLPQQKEFILPKGTKSSAHFL